MYSYFEICGVPGSSDHGYSQGSDMVWMGTGGAVVGGTRCVGNGGMGRRRNGGVGGELVNSSRPRHTTDGHLPGTGLTADYKGMEAPVPDSAVSNGFRPVVRLPTHCGETYILWPWRWMGGLLGVRHHSPAFLQ